MRAYTTRPSRRVPGLDIAGHPGRYRLYATTARDDGRTHTLPVLDGRVLPDGSEINTFRVIRDAEAAAERLVDVLPWSDAGRLAETIAGLGREVDALRYRLIEALTGRTIADLEAERAEHNDRVRRHYDGTGAREAFDADIRAAGHDPTWKRKGQRTFWATCPCGTEFRSSYQSMSRSFARSGLNGPCANTTEES